MARPGIKGTSITGTAFKLRPELLSKVSDGADSLARRIGASHPRRRTPSPSNALWMRTLIAYAHERLESIPLEERLRAMHSSSQPSEHSIGVSLRIPEELRISLRKLEVSIQQLDWSVDFNRNAALNFIVFVFSDALKKELDLGLYPQTEPSSAE